MTKPRNGRISHTHSELKELIMHYYKDAVDNGLPENIHSMRFRGLRGGRLELVRAWDALAEEGKLPHREKRNFKIKEVLKRPDKEKPKRKTPRNFTKQCVAMYGRKKMIEEHKVIASWLKTHKQATKTDLKS